MAKENAKKFDQLLVSDENLQAKIRAAMDAYTGDRRDEQAVFEAVIRPLAEEAGLPFTFEDAKTCVEEEGEISLEEGDAVAGGEGACFFIGAVDKPEVGYCETYKNNEQLGGAACAYVGVGIAYWN